MKSVIYFLILVSVGFAGNTYTNGSKCYCDSVHVDSYIIRNAELQVVKINIEIPYLSGKVNGITYAYYPSGRVYSKSSTVFGELVGTFSMFYENGKVKEMKRYFKDKQIGKAMCFDASGKSGECK